VASENAAIMNLVGPVMAKGESKGPKLRIKATDQQYQAVRESREKSQFSRRRRIE